MIYQCIMKSSSLPQYQHLQAAKPDSNIEMERKVPITIMIIIIIIIIIVITTSYYSYYQRQSVFLMIICQIENYLTWLCPYSMYLLF